MKKFFSFTNNKIMYPKNMKKGIFDYEDKRYELYSNMIHEIYDEFFKNYGGKIVVEKGWRNDILNSLSKHFSYKRIPMICGYMGLI